jgi:hypothetical protein
VVRGVAPREIETGHCQIHRDCRRLLLHSQR